MDCRLTVLFRRPSYCGQARQHPLPPARRPPRQHLAHHARLVRDFQPRGLRLRRRTQRDRRPARPTTPSPARNPSPAAFSTTTPATTTPRWAPSSRRLPCRPGLLPTAQQRTLKGRIRQERYRSQSRCKRSCRGSGSHTPAARGGPSAALSVAGGQSMNAATLRRQPLRGSPRRLLAPIDLHHPRRFPAVLRRAMPTRPEWPERPDPIPAAAAAARIPNGRKSPRPQPRRLGSRGPRRRPKRPSSAPGSPAAPGCLRQFYRCG